VESVPDFCETRSFVAVRLSDLQGIVAPTAEVTQRKASSRNENRHRIVLCVCVCVCVFMYSCLITISLMLNNGSTITRPHMTDLMLMVRGSF
jgi:hypothetical protein